MAQVTLTVGGRQIPVACRDGEEARVRELGVALDTRWPQALKAAGGISAERAFFLLALMMADALDESERRPPAPGTLSETMVVRIAERLERLADTLEHGDAST